MADFRARMKESGALLPWSAAAAGLAIGLVVTAEAAIDGTAVVFGSRALASAMLVGAAVVGGLALGATLPRTRKTGGAIEVAALAHDVRAPLATTRTLLQILQSGAVGNLSAEAMDTASRAGIAVARAQAVLEGALRASSPDAEVPMTDVATVLDRALQSVAGGIAQSGAIVERGELPTVRADAIALERVLVNLVVNAIAHARPGEAPHIEVGARQQGRGWLISVRDHGPGVPAQIRESAFEPGVRGFSPDGPVSFGLGLSTVRRLVEQQGGRAWIDPDTSDGTCVQMLLPAA